MPNGKGHGFLIFAFAPLDRSTHAGYEERSLTVWILGHFRECAARKTRPAKALIEQALQFQVRRRLTGRLPGQVSAVFSITRFHSTKVQLEFTFSLLGSVPVTYLIASARGSLESLIVSGIVYT